MGMGCKSCYVSFCYYDRHCVNYIKGTGLVVKFLNTIDKTKKLVVCLAGNLCSPEVFSKINMPPQWEKVYVDYLEGNGPWDIEHMADELISKLRESTNQPVVVAAYSAGGVLALGMAAKAPDLVKGLVVSNTGPCSIGHGNPNFVQELRANAANEEYMRKFLSSCFYGPIDKPFEDKLWSYAREVNVEAACQVSETLRQVDYRTKLQHYKNPVAIIHGKLDTRRKLNSVDMLQECMPQSVVTLLATGHTPMWEDSSGYQKALNNLLEKIHD